MDGEGGKFLLDVDKGVYWHLNSTALVLLEGLTTGRSLDEVATAVAAAAGVDEERVRADCAVLLADLRRARLVEGDAR